MLLRAAIMGSVRAKHWIIEEFVGPNASVTPQACDINPDCLIRISDPPAFERFNYQNFDTTADW